MTQPFADSVEHLLAELERIDLLIRARIAGTRKVQAEDEHFRGLYISEEEVDKLLLRPLGTPTWLSAAAPGRWAQIEDALAGLEARLRMRRERSLAGGAELRLERLRSLFALERFDLDVLLVCMAAELDVRYEKLYAYLQDDVTRKRPTVDLMLNLLTRSPAEHLAARRHFTPDSALRRARLIEPVDDPQQPQPTLLSTALKPDDRIVQYLLGSQAIDTRLRPFAVLIDPPAPPDPDSLEAPGVRGLRPLLVHAGAPAVIHLSGAPGVGKQTVVEALCRECGLALLCVNVDRLLADAAGLATAFVLIEREALLQHAAVLFKGVDAFRGEGQQAALALLREALSGCRVPCFLAGEQAWEGAPPPAAQRYVHVVLPRPDASQRLRAWRHALAARGADDSGADVAAVASRFRLTQGQIGDAAATAVALARLRGGDAAQPPVTADLFEACRINSNRRLGTLARKIAPRYRWDDIVLPAHSIEQLREICNHMKYRERVFCDWGFDRKLALGKGLMVLFAGPSGTGKTMAADVIAGELGLELYKIDLSSVISKYIGETEKNLARIFDEAETSNAILFFDEADALFGKRSEVKDSHDRYANIEVGYLLQRMEEYEGVAILATNLRKNMDDAFVRRLHFTLDLPFPDEAHRLRIWQGIWPHDVPLERDLDLPLLARRFEMTGGNIRNVALAAAFLAADDGDVVRMSHVVHATQRELQKTGKLLRERDFAEHGLRFDGRAQEAP